MNELENLNLEENVVDQNRVLEEIERQEAEKLS